MPVDSGRLERVRDIPGDGPEPPKDLAKCWRHRHVTAPVHRPCACCRDMKRITWTGEIIGTAGLGLDAATWAANDTAAHIGRDD